MSVLGFYFGWPDGAVWSNLLASVICVGVAWWRLRARSVTHHAEQLAQAARHHKEALAQSAAQHEELKRHVVAHCSDVKAHVSAVVSVAADSQAAQERVARPPGVGFGQVRPPRRGERM
jgi:hypothetical protein